MGRRLGYLWRYQDAIAMFSKGDRAHPNNPKLYRHRGHRYITVRQFDRAIADFEKATTLIKGTPDEIEPDGAPNPTGQAAQHAALQHLVSPGARPLPERRLSEGGRCLRRVHEGLDQRRFDDRHERLAVDDADAPEPQGRRRASVLERDHAEDGDPRERLVPPPPADVQGPREAGSAARSRPRPTT